MNGVIDPQQLEVWQLFLRMQGRLMEQLRAEMEAQQSLPLTWFDVLLQLSFAPAGQLRMSALVGNLMLTRSGLTRRIDRMEASGMVERLGCDSDARGVVVALTPAGRIRLRDAVPPHLARISRYFAGQFSDEEAQAASSAFRKVLAALDTLPAANCVAVR